MKKATPTHQLELRVHELAQLFNSMDPTALISGAVQHHFSDKAELVRRDVRDLFWQGRISLLIGLVFVTLCLLAAQAIGQSGSSTARTIARESLTIVGWVAMWRPLQLFLYDWWPLDRRRATYKALARAQVKVVQGQG